MAMTTIFRTVILCLGALIAVGLAGPVAAQDMTSASPSLFQDQMYTGANLGLARRYLNTYSPWNQKDTFWQTLYALPKMKDRYNLFSRQWPRYYFNIWDIERNPRYQPPEDPNDDNYHMLTLHQVTGVPDYTTDVRVTPVWNWEKKALAELEKRWALIQRGVVILDNDTTGRRPTYFYWDRPQPVETVRPDDLTSIDAYRDPTVPVPDIVRRLLNPNLSTPITQGAFMPVIRQRLEQLGVR
jgi:hypothetical protein